MYHSIAKFQNTLQNYVKKQREINRSSYFQALGCPWLSDDDILLVKIYWTHISQYTQYIFKSNQIFRLYYQAKFLHSALYAQMHETYIHSTYGPNPNYSSPVAINVCIIQQTNAGNCPWWLLTPSGNDMARYYNTPMLHFGPHVTFQTYVRQILAHCTSLFGPLYVTFWPCGHAHKWTPSTATPTPTPWHGPKVIMAEPSTKNGCPVLILQIFTSYNRWYVSYFPCWCSVYS